MCYSRNWIDCSVVQTWGKRHRSNIRFGRTRSRIFLSTLTSTIQGIETTSISSHMPHALLNDLVLRAISWAIDCAIPRCRPFKLAFVVVGIGIIGIWKSRFFSVVHPTTCQAQSLLSSMSCMDPMLFAGELEAALDQVNEERRTTTEHRARNERPRGSLTFNKMSVHILLL